MNRSQQSGFSLMELLVVLIIGFFLFATVAINTGPRYASFDIEGVAALVVTSVGKAHRAALSGQDNAAARSFNLSNVLLSRHPGILVTSAAPAATNNCTQGQTTNCPRSICISGQLFCYDAQNQFEFEQYSGEIKKPNPLLSFNSGRAVFIISPYRKLAVLVSPDGHTDIAELINGQWRARTDLQRLTTQP